MIKNGQYTYLISPWISLLKRLANTFVKNTNGKRKKFYLLSSVLKNHFYNLSVQSIMYLDLPQLVHNLSLDKMFSGSGNFARNFQYCLFHVRNAQCIFQQNDWEAVILFVLHPDIANLLVVSQHSRCVYCCLQASCSLREALLHAWMILEPAGFLKIDFSGLAGVNLVFFMNVQHVS